MKKITALLPIIIMIIGFSYSAKSQNITKKTDLIMLYDKSEIEAIITEINEDEIKYRKPKNTSGPLYSIKKSNVYMIIYSSGEREKFESVVPQNTENTKAVASQPLPSSKATIQNSSKQNSSANTANVEPKVIETASVGDVFDNGVGTLDIGIVANNLAGTSIPPIVLNAFTNKFSKKISKYLFFGLNNQFTLIQDYQSIDLSLGGRYYFNGLLKLNPEKFMVYGGVSLININYSSTSVNGGANQDIFVSNFGIIGSIGATYYLTKRTGLFSEITLSGGSAFKVGLNSRLYR